MMLLIHIDEASPATQRESQAVKFIGAEMLIRIGLLQKTHTHTQTNFEQ